MSWMGTNSGKRFHFGLINQDAIVIDDIAHALSNICRYNGQIDEFYSVAQHSVLISHYVPACYSFEGLMHDAAESYIGDMTHDLKHRAELAGYLVIEHRVERAIATKYSLTFPWPAEVKLADRRICISERRDLFKRKPDWDDPEYNVESFPERIIPWAPQVARRMFLERFNELTHGGVGR